MRPVRLAGRYSELARRMFSTRADQIETGTGRCRPFSQRQRQFRPEKLPGPRLPDFSTESGRPDEPKRSGFGKAHNGTPTRAPLGETGRSSHQRAPWRHDANRSCHIYRNARKTETAARPTRRRSDARSYGISRGASQLSGLQNPSLRGVSNGDTVRCGTVDRSRLHPLPEAPKNIQDTRTVGALQAGRG